MEGFALGLRDGSEEGDNVGLLDGNIDGIELGPNWDGFTLGLTVGMTDRLALGLVVG